MDAAGKRVFPNHLLLLVLSVLVTNTVTLLLFSTDSPFRSRNNFPVTALEQQIDRLRKDLADSNHRSDALLKESAHLASLLSNQTLSRCRTDAGVQDQNGPDDLLPEEYLEFVSAHKLPYGHNPNIGSDRILPPAGRACDKLPQDLKRYMDYTVGGPCPDDDVLEQQLLLKGCEPLPRWRCVSPGRLPEQYVEPTPLPDAFWSIPDDSSVPSWKSYSCKNYSCLVDRKNQPDFDDCKDCFVGFSNP